MDNQTRDRLYGRMLDLIEFMYEFKLAGSDHINFYCLAPDSDTKTIGQEMVQILQDSGLEQYQ